MEWNLNVYWSGKARRPWLFLVDAWVDFAVTTLLRILHTLETGEIISKPQALLVLQQRFPQWSHLASIFNPPSTPSIGVHFPRRITRATETVRFIREMIDRGGGEKK